MSNKNAFKVLKVVSGECPICDHEHDLQYGALTEDIVVRKEKINVTSNAYYCTTEGQFFLDLEDEEEKFQQVYREYRRRKGLLQPDEIREVRTKYGLSQREFAQILGFGEITIHRYESGAIQDDAHNSSLLLISNTSAFIDLFERKRGELNPKTVKKVEDKLKKLMHSSCQLKLAYEGTDLNVYKGETAEWKSERTDIETPIVRLPVGFIRTKPDAYVSVNNHGELSLAA